MRRETINVAQRGVHSRRQLLHVFRALLFHDTEFLRKAPKLQFGESGQRSVGHVTAVWAATNLRCDIARVLRNASQSPLLAVRLAALASASCALASSSCVDRLIASCADKFIPLSLSALSICCAACCCRQ